MKNNQYQEWKQPPDRGQFQSQDIALAGLARLGVLQFDCNRAFVSIVDGTHQHVIAEATKSGFLENNTSHQAGDGLYHGLKSFDLNWGVAPDTVRFFTKQKLPFESANLNADHARYYVRDLSQDDAHKDRPYVVDWPAMRFYVAVPIRSRTGYILGSYSVVDDRPRSEFGDTEFDSMQDIANAIAQHIEAARLSCRHRRTEMLFKSLTSFVKDHDEFDPAESHSATLNKTSSTPRLKEGENSLSIERPDLAKKLQQTTLQGHGKSFGSSSEKSAETSSMFSNEIESQPSETSFPLPPERPASARSRNFDRRGSASQNAPLIESNPVNESQPSAIQVASKFSKIFRRASVLLQDSMNLDGVLFVDGSSCNAGV